MIRPESDHDRAYGFSVNDEDAKHFSVFGEVLVVPRQLVYAAKIGSRSIRERDRFRRLNAMTMEWETKMELEVGERVLIHHRAKVDAENFDDGNLIIPYEQVICAVEPVVKPVNGYVLVETKEVVDGEGTCTTDGVGIVRHVGTSNTAYMFSKKKDRFDPVLGQTVYYNPKHGYPLEYGMHQEFNNFVAIRRKDIYLTV
jgi:hypothetical protein